MSDTKTLLAQQKQLLRTRMAELRADIDVIKAQSAPIYKEMDAAIAEHQVLGARIQVLTDQANAIEQPRLHALKMELAEVARAESAIKV